MKNKHAFLDTITGVFSVIFLIIISPALILAALVLFIRYPFLKLAHKNKPDVFYQDNVLGSFKLDRFLNMYEAEAEWLGNTIILCFHNGAESEMKYFTEILNSFFTNQTEWQNRIFDYTTEHFFHTFTPNEKAECRERMILYSITIEKNADFTFILDCDKVQDELMVKVNGNMEKGLIEVNLA